MGDRICDLSTLPGWGVGDNAAIWQSYEDTRTGPVVYEVPDEDVALLRPVKFNTGDVYVQGRGKNVSVLRASGYVGPLLVFCCSQTAGNGGIPTQSDAYRPAVSDWLAGMGAGFKGLATGNAAIWKAFPGPAAYGPKITGSDPARGDRWGGDEGTFAVAFLFDTGGPAAWGSYECGLAGIGSMNDPSPFAFCYHPSEGGRLRIVLKLDNQPDYLGAPYQSWFVTFPDPSARLQEVALWWDASSGTLELGCRINGTNCVMTPANAPPDLTGRRLKRNRGLCPFTIGVSRDALFSTPYSLVETLPPDFAVLGFKLSAVAVKTNPATPALRYLGAGDSDAVCWLDGTTTDGPRWFSMGCGTASGTSDRLLGMVFPRVGYTGGLEGVTVLDLSTSLGGIALGSTLMVLVERCRFDDGRNGVLDVLFDVGYRWSFVDCVISGTECAIHYAGAIVSFMRCQVDGGNVQTVLTAGINWTADDTLVLSIGPNQECVWDFMAHLYGGNYIDRTSEVDNENGLAVSESLYRIEAHTYATNVCIEDCYAAHLGSTAVFATFTEPATPPTNPNRLRIAGLQCLDATAAGGISVSSCWGGYADLSGLAVQTITGTGSENVLAYGGGAQGPEGPAGPTGPTGPTGPQGTPGATLLAIFPFVPPTP
jgi:hypothetical protein